MTYNRTQFLSTFDQMFEMDKPARNMLYEENHWHVSFPNDRSGACYTYNPHFQSNPKVDVGMYITMKSLQWDPDLLIFFHEENKFFYSENGISQFYLDLSKLEKKKNFHPKALGKKLVKNIVLFSI